MLHPSHRSLIKGLPLLLLTLSGLLISLHHHSEKQTASVRGERPDEVARTTLSESVPNKTEQERTVEAYSKLPLSFVANEGQADSQVKFYSNGKGYGLFLTQTEAVLALKQVSAKKGGTAVLRMKLKDANPQAEVQGLDGLPGRVNYFGGASSQKRHTDIATYSKVRYRNIYPDIDLIYYGNQGQLEYDFAVAPGADPRLINLDFDGADEVRVTGAGELLVRTKGEMVRMNRPVIYQVDDEGERREVSGQYSLRGRNEVGFSIADYDASRTLVIDPVLIYSTYLGGTFSDSAYAIAVDNEGNAYITGSTYSPDFPITASAFQTTTIGVTNDRALTDVFITKLNRAGNAVIYSTYLGGTDAVQDFNDYLLEPSLGNDEAWGIAVDGSGNVFVTGTTTSIVDFPTTPGAYRTGFERSGATSSRDVFVTKLNPAGNALVYSTRLGGTGSDVATAIEIDGSGNAYVAGKTGSTDFPVTFGSLTQSPSDAFAIKLNPTGTALVYSVLLGKGVGGALALDSAGNLYIAGQSFSSSFAVTPGAFQTVAPGNAGAGFLNGFVTKINAAGNGLLYSTFLGSTGSDVATDIAVDASGNAYVSVFTDSVGFPTTPGAFMSSGRAGEAPVLVKLNPAGSGLVYSTYMVGSIIRALAVNSAGEVIVTGSTESGLTVTSDAFQKVPGGSSDAFLARLNASGTALLYSTYLGGSEQDHGMCMAQDSAGAVYVAGLTSSTNFPLTQGPFQTTPSANSFDIGAFVVKVGEAATTQTYSISGRLTDQNGNGIAHASVTLDGSPGGIQFTDAAGNYAFGSLTSGSSYTITPSSPYYDFSPQSRTFSNLSSNQTADFSGTVRRHSITGMIKNTQGNPIAGVTMTLSGSQSATTQTDAGGNYAFNDLSAIGTYTVRPTKNGYAFIPFNRTFGNLAPDSRADFTAILVYTINGRVVAPNGQPIRGIPIAISSNNIFVRRITTDINGNYSFTNLPGGNNYRVVPEHLDYTYSPAVYNFDNLSTDQTADFTATYRYGSISGRITDADGKGLYYVLVTLSGPVNYTLRTDGNGNYAVSHLLKGGSYTVSASEFGYTMSPGPVTFNITGDHTVNFTATLKKPKPFLDGNILTTNGKYLAEYTPAGTLVQDVIVPFPVPNNGNISYNLGDLVLDKDGEVEIYNGSDAASYLTGYSFVQQSWRHHTYPGWNPWVGYHTFDGIATFGNYVFVTDKVVNDFGQPVQTQGIIRIDLTDYSSQRFAETVTFCHLTMGLDGLLYGIVGGTAGSQVQGYNPTTMQLVKTVNLTDFQNFTENVHQIAVNSSGEIFANSFYVRHFDSNGKMVKSLQLGSNLTDIEFSNNGRLGVAADGAVTLLDESLNILGSFRPPTGVSHLTFTKTATASPSVQFDATSYSVNEASGTATITVTRTGDTSLGATVKYQTSDSTNVNFRCDPSTPGQQTGAASRKCDYHIAVGRLRFAPGETSKPIILSIVNDAYIEAPESLSITLSDPIGAGLGTQQTATVTITDNDTGGQPNPIDSTAFYVHQLYVDLLSREPEPTGLQGWINRIDLCGQPGQAPPPCDRVTVGGDGFLRSAEFFDRQFFVIRLYRTGLGRIPRYEDVGDLAYVSGFLTDADLESNKQELIAEIMSRPEFSNSYNGLTNGAYVDKLVQTAGVTIPQSVKDVWMVGLSGGTRTRAQVYRELSERPEVISKYLHEAQVVSAYYGFFTRNPDGAYLNFLQRLDSGEINLGDLANAFINSIEYRSRFGP